MQKTWERWEYFPIQISPFGYNETIVNEYFPMSREQASAKWYKWQDNDYPIDVPVGTELLQTKDLPQNIKDVDDDILKKAIVCEISWKPFRIIKMELDFYLKHNLPLPKRHPDERNKQRLNKLPSRNFYFRNCDNCGKQVISVYPADSEFKVYCEECYNKEIY